MQTRNISDFDFKEKLGSEATNVQFEMYGWKWNIASSGWLLKHSAEGKFGF